MALIAQAATPRIPPPLPALLRRLPHLPRSRQGRTAHRRRHARHDRRGPGASPTASAPCPPTIPSSAAPRRTPTSTSRRAKPSTPTTSPPPPSCRTRWTSSPPIAGRQYHLFDYVGAPDAERVIIMMGSGAEVAQEAVEALVAAGEKVGLLKVRLYRPFSVEHLRRRAARSRSRSIAVLDRTKEPGAIGEPLYCDVVTALAEMGVAEEGHRRALRPVLQGIHPRHGQGRLRRTRSSRTPRTTSPSASTTTSPTPASTTIPSSPPKSRHRARPVLRPRRRRHRRRQQELHQDHRRRDRQLRPGLLRLRLQEVRLHHHLAPALRPQAASTPAT